MLSHVAYHTAIKSTLNWRRQAPSLAILRSAVVCLTMYRFNYSVLTNRKLLQMVHVSTKSFAVAQYQVLSCSFNLATDKLWYGIGSLGVNTVTESAWHLVKLSWTGYSYPGVYLATLYRGSNPPPEKNSTPPNQALISKLPLSKYDKHTFTMSYAAYLWPG